LRTVRQGDGPPFPGRPGRPPGRAARFGVAKHGAGRISQENRAAIRRAARANQEKGADAVQYVNEKTFPRKEPKAAIRKELCDGCAICVDVCPTRCLEVVVNPKRPNAKIVRMTPELCSGCGACQGTCPKEAIFIPGLSTADLRGYVDQALESAGVRP
jgi:heterodisulfide reductase subunit A